MSSTIIMPQLGETVAEGKIITWFKKPGDAIRIGDKLFEVETDKVTVEVEAIAAGTLSDIRVRDGETAKVGTVVAVIGAEAGEPAPMGASGGPSPPRPEPLLSPFEEVASPAANYGKAKGPGGIRITPLARRLIAQNGLDIVQIAASAQARGQTKIAEEDVRRAMAEPRAAALRTETAAPPAFVLEGSSIALSPIRQKTAARLAENWRSIPHVFQAIEIDFTAVDAVRARHKQGFKAMHGLPLTYLPFIARAACLALAAFPNINARFDGQAIFPSRDVNLGIAVDLDHKGLVVPVVRNASELTVEGLAKAIGRMIEKARANRLTADDMAGGTYSITNNGAFGTLFTAPIINAPQVAILSSDAIRLRPAVVETPQGPFVAPRLMGILGQSFDHRAFDGAYSAAFLSRLKSIIETRNWSQDMALPA